MSTWKAGGILGNIFGNVINFVIIVLVFGLCILIHEFGHFITAKKNGVNVMEFAIGMGPKLFSKEVGETAYSLRLLPIGGYCAMLGEDFISDDPRAFCNIHVWKRILIVVAGALFNFILAFVLSVVLLSLAGVNTNEVGAVVENSAAQEIGIEPGDRIIRLGGSRIYNFREISVYMQFVDSYDPIEIVIERNGERMTKTIVPKKIKNTNIYHLGVAGGFRKASGPFQIIGYSFLEVRYWIKTTFFSLKQLVTGHVGVKDLSGPVGIGSAMNEVIEEAQETGGALDVFINVLNFCILLTANLGVMNLLPLPALDGGRLVFLLIEAITKKKVPAHREAMIHAVGMVLLFGLMAVVMLQDIIKLFH